MFNLISGTGIEAGRALASHPGVDMVSFTGSTVVGREIHSLSSSVSGGGGGGHIKRFRSELGGKSACVILPDATECQIRAMCSDVLENSGQSCTALSRLIAPRDRYGEIIDLANDVFESVRVVEATDASAKRGDMGPLVSQGQLDSVREYMRRGLEVDGARLITGGLEFPPDVPRSGYFVRPTLFADVTNDMIIAREEIFGPVLGVIPYDSEEDAIDITNDTPYGLSNAVIGRDLDHALRVARRLRSGEVKVNTRVGHAAAPFGGYKSSGDGREFGRWGLEEFLQVKAMHVPPGSTVR